jgi:integrase
MPKIKINNTTLAKIELPATSQILYWDTELTGFGIRATPTALVFVAQRRVKGKTVRTIIGKPGEITPAEARVKAASALASMREGRNLNEVSRQEKVNSITLRQVYKAYMNDKTLQPRTIETYDWNLETNLKCWLDLPLKNIDKTMVRERYKGLCNKNGPRGQGIGSANQALHLLSALYNYAAAAYDKADGEPIVGDNPVNILSQLGLWIKLPPRVRVVDEKDLAAWYQGVLALGDRTFGAYILFVLFSGLRKSETLRLEWTHVDSRNRVLNIPGKITKNGKPRSVPLTDVMLSIIEKRRALPRNIGNPYIFNAEKGRGHLKEPKTAVGSVSKSSQIDWSLHDLRRTYTTAASRIDVSYIKLKYLIGHSLTGDVTSNHYTHLNVDDLREPAQRITDYFKKHTGMSILLHQVVDEMPLSHVVNQ